jgi:hypothetical protein
MDVALILAVLVLVLLALVLVAVYFRRSDERTLTFGGADPPRRVAVDLRAGAVACIGTGSAEILVRRTVRWAMARPHTSERVDGGTLRIEVGAVKAWHLGADVRYRIEAPAGCDIRVRTGAGAVSAQDTAGSLDLHSGAGQVTLAGVADTVRAVTRAGAINGTALAVRELDVETNAGSIALAFDTPPERVAARTNAGAVDLALPAEHYAVDATAYAGRADVDIVDDPAASRRIVAHSNAGAVRVRGR